MYTDKKEWFYTKSIKGKIIEASFGIIITIISIPFVVFYFIGKKVSDWLEKVDNKFAMFLSKKGL